MTARVYAPKKSIRDYSSKPRGQNPLFPKEGKSGSKKSWLGPMRVLGLGVIAIFAVLFGFGYLVWGSPLALTKITVTGATTNTERRVRTIIDEQMGKKVLGIFPQSNTLIFRTSKAEDALKGSFFFDQLSLRKKLPHELHIEVIERDAQAALVMDDKLLALDESCTVIRELTNDEVAGLPFLPTGVQKIIIPDEASVDTEAPSVITASDAVSTGLPASAIASPLPRNQLPVLTFAPNTLVPLPGKTVCEPEMLQFINKVYAELGSTAQSEPLWFMPDDEAQSLDVMMEGEWHVFLSSALPFESQANRLSVVLREKIGKDRDRLKYVDLRYNETVFFRLKE